MSYSKAIEPGSVARPTSVAWTPDLGISPMDPEVASICEKAARWFGSLGAKVADASPDVHDAQELFQVKWNPDTAPACLPACVLFTCLPLYRLLLLSSCRKRMG